MYAIHYIGGAVNVKKMPKAQAVAYVKQINDNALSGAFPESARLATSAEARELMQDRILDLNVLERRTGIYRLPMSELVEVFNECFA